MLNVLTPTLTSLFPTSPLIVDGSTFSSTGTVAAISILVTSFGIVT